uniref:E1A binding protein p400 n=1 Tax=Sparus aurata TaxID=8175 RepID=A0A671TIH6_SPAAU
MHHGSGSQNMQRQLQRSKSVSAPEQQATVNHPQSPVTTFSSSASPSAPQSPNYQIIMSRSPVTGQNMNITLQNVGQMVTGNQQITLTPLPIQNPASPGFQHTTPQWRFEHAPSSYIQVTSPVPQPMQPQSPTQHSPVPLQSVTRPGAPAATLGVCGQSPTRFVEAGMLVRQISLGSPSGSGHFVYQEGAGLAQIAQATPGQVQLASPGAPGSVRERRLSQPHSQTGGTIHHLGPQSPVATGTALPTLGSPGHITTSNLPPQISSIIQGQLARPMIFEKTSQGVVAGVGATATFSIPSSIPPSSPSLTSPTQGIPNNPLAPTSMAAGTMKKQVPKKLEEIAPSTPEIAQLRKQCLEHHTKKMDSLKEVFKEYLIELFFLQHLQGNMMDYLAFKKKPCVPLYTYLRQNDLDLEEEEEEEEQSEVINDEVKVVTGKDGQAVTPVAIATQLPPNVSAAFSVQQQLQVREATLVFSTYYNMDAFKRQQAMVQADQAKRSRIEVGRHGLIFQHPGVAPLGSPGVPLQQLMPTAQGGMPPTPQAVQIAGQKPNQQQYDPSKGPPVQNAASLHTPPPQLPSRLPQGALPMAGLPMALSQQPQLVDNTAQTAGQLQAQVKVQTGGPVLSTVNPHTQLQTVALARPGAESNQPVQRIMTNSISMTSMSSAPLSAPNAVPTPHAANPLRPLGSNINPSTQSKLTGTNGISTVKIGGFGQNATMQPSQETSQDKQVEQSKLENQVHQRISELRKEGQWSASRLPKLVEALRPKSHWDYLLEEMQWMAADFAQERRWKEAVAKKLVRTCARYHQERKKSEERSKKEREIHLRHIASTIAREVEFFWSNIEQVVEIKLQFEIYEKRLKSLSLQKVSYHNYLSLCPYWSFKCFCVWLLAEMSLDALMKQYAGAYSDSFEWPQPSLQSDEDDMDETEELECPAGSPLEAVMIDSLLSVDQYRADKATLSDSDGKPARDIAEVAAATEQILPKGSLRTTSSTRSPAPFLLHGALREYQQIGVDWLANLHKKHLNGILADETGLGKTVQTVAYMAHLAGQEGIWGPHLIVVRTCKLLNWEVEFKRWCPGLKILLYLGNRRERRSKRMWWGEANSFHVCVTSYKLLMKDQSHFLRRRWRHLVLDEVQLLKSMTEKHWATVFALRSEQRILLINTPLQNTLKELWTMIHFLLPGITRSYSDFPVKAGTDQNQDYCHKLVIRLHRMIQPFILRRSKRDVEKQLPKKYEHILKCRLSSRQKSLYEDILTQPGAQEALKTGHFVSVLQVLMQLQRVCNHPELVAPRENSSSYFSSSLQYNVPMLVLEALKNDSSKVYTCIANMSIFDLINNENRLTRYQTEEAVPKLKVTQQLIEEIYTGPDPTPRPKPCPIKPLRLFQPVQYGTKPEGRLAAITSTVGQRPPTSSPTTSTSTSTNSQSALPRGKSPVSTATTTAISQGGDVVKIAQLANIAGSQNRISQPETPVTLQFQGNKFTLSPSQLRQLTTGQPLQLQGTLGNVPPIVTLNIILFILYFVLVCVVPPAVAPPPHLYAANPPVPYSLEKKSLQHQLQDASAPHSAEIHHFASRHLFHFISDPFFSKGKLEALAILLQKLRSESRRVLIFTQMVKMLDILEAFLDHRQLTYVRVDESFTPDERQESMKKFNRNRKVFCSILTNRCCAAVGTVFDADTIIFYDTDLNPSMDARTQEWCDKIGRSKDIHIYRLESGNSIEEKLLKNGTKDLIREVAAQGTDYTLAFLTQRTIQDLFEVEAGSGEKVEEFVVLHQEPSASEAISPRVARPYIQALHSINLDAQQEDQQQQQKKKKEEEEVEQEELAGKDATEGDQESEKCSKRGWELQQLQKLKEEEEERQIMEGDEDLFTYTREDAYNMVWTPPTPPQDDNDIYIDSVMMLMYDTTPMHESKLPPVYIRKEHKRLKMDPSAAARKKKKGHGETVIPPRSLFEKASMLKVRREGKDQKKNFSLKQQAPFAKPLPSLVKPAMEAGQDNPEWLISEDWALLQAVKQLLELPLNLTIVSPAHTPNWDLVSDVVNSCSRIYRSPKQCRNRYENVIIPREEGKSKNSRPLRTCQIYTQDDNATHIQLYNSRFELMKIIASKRSPPIKPLLGMNPFQKNPKHASVLAESGISYDKPLPPIQVASQRAERIAKEKKALAEQQKAQQLAQQQQAGAPQAQAVPGQAQAPAAAQAQAQVPQAVTVTGAAAVPNAAVLLLVIQQLINSSLFLPATVGGNVIVNTVAGVPPSPFQANKRLASPVIPGTLSVTGAGAQVVHTQQRAVTAAAPAEVVAIATGQGVRAVTPVTASAVVSTTLSPVQSQTRPLVTQVTSATGMPLSQGKPLTPAHLQMLRQQQLQQHQQQQQQQQQQAASPQIKGVGKPQVHHQYKCQRAAAQGQQAAGAQQATQVQPAQAAQSNPQLAVAAPRPGAVLTGTTVANLQVARLTRVPTQGQIQAQAGQTAQVTLTKPPVVSVPAVVSSAGVTTLPVTVAGISVAIGQAQKTGVFNLCYFPKIGTQQVTVQAAQPAQQQQQKVTYATTQLQTGIKTQFFTTSIAQAQKPTGAQQIQVAKLPQIVQQQSTVANLQQIVSSPQQAQTVTLTQAATSAPAQVQMIPTGTATAQVVGQKIIQQQVVTAATSPQIQTPPPHSPAQQPATPSPQQPIKGQARQGGIRAKTPAKPSGGGS